MLVNLLKYEFIKKLKSMRYVLLAYGLIEIILLVTGKILLDRSNVSYLFIEGTTKDQQVGFPLIMSMVLYFTIIVILIIFPFVEGVTRYEKDLSGKQAPLELMIPTASWKKVVSKLIISTCLTIFCLIIASISITIYVSIMSNFDHGLIDAVFSWLGQAFDSPFKVLLVIVDFFISYASFFLLVCFCTAIAKWITHKNKISTFISILTFSVSLALIIYLSNQTDKYPIASFTLFGDLETGLTYSVSSIILDISILVATFIGTSYIMERKIEN